ncbi:MAG TPA: CHAT domain-containing protein, partial [Chitinophagaceae bacterium]|nr:CHAT domain-containing protein [Chitinophagaceae bacterium]
NSNFSARNFMGVAPVQFPSKLGLSSLPGSDESLERLQSYFKRSHNLLNAKANRNNFLESYHRYKIIQLYTHASDSGFYREPVIYFSDSALLLSDLLYEANPATRLIVLSACETGTGKLYEGEGVFGFNRGFAALGIPTSISNLWQVENTSTYKLTELFYHYLSKGLPIDVALQKAKIDFIKSATGERQLPYFWAAPILTGRTDAMELKKNYAWMYLIGAICFGGIVFGFLSTRIKKHELQEQRNAKYPNKSSTITNQANG